MTVKISIFNL